MADDNSTLTMLKPGSDSRMIDDLRKRIAALDAVAARDAFLAVAAHELRNPMTPILGQVQRLARIARAPDCSVEQLAQGLERIEWLIQQYVRRATTLLDVSRITTGKMRLDLAEVDLVEVLHEVAALVAPATQYAGSQLDIIAPPRLVGTWDRLALEQILENLLTNAAKYGAGKPITIEVRAGSSEAEIVIKDRGIGISGEDQARIFERFERVVARGSRSAGFGVGLWVTRQLVEAMGGVIAVESAAGLGSTFLVTLPLCASDDHP